MGAPKVPYPQRHPQPLGSLRLKLSPTFERGTIGGLWRPHGRELTREGSQLVDGFPEARGRIDRLVYAPADWDVVAPQLFSRFGRIKIGYFADERPNGLVLLRLRGSGTVMLRVMWTPPFEDGFVRTS